MDTVKIDCASPESAHALHAYLLVELGNKEERPNISAKVRGSTLYVTHDYDDQQVQQEWTVQLIGYRDGRESLDDMLREARHVLKELRRMADDTERMIGSVLGIRE